MKKRTNCSRIRHALFVRASTCILILGLCAGWPIAAQTIAPTRFPPQGVQYAEGTATSQNWLYSGGNKTPVGDNNGANVVFFEIPDTTTQTLYFAVRNPDVDEWNGYGINDPDRLYTSGSGWVNYALFGGTGAYSAAAGQHLNHTNFNNGGTQLDSITGGSYGNVTQTAFRVGTWVYFNGVSPSQGEHIGNKYYFRLTAVVSDYANVAFRHSYQFDVSLTNSGSPTGLSSGYAFSYDITFTQMSKSATPAPSGPITWDFYSFLPFGSGSPMTANSYAFVYNGYSNIVVSNWVDNLSVPQTQTSTTGAGGVIGTNGKFPADANLQSATYTVTSAQTNASWHLQFSTANSTMGGSAEGGAELYFTDGSLLPIYSTSYPGVTPDHFTLSPATSSALTTTGSLSYRVQVVDSSGNPIPYITNVQVIATPSVNPRINTTLTSPQTFATDTTGGVDFTLSDTSAETVNLSIGTVLVGANGTATATFNSSLPPSISSASNLTFTQGSPATLPVVTITANGAASIVNGSSIVVSYNGSGSVQFNTGVTPDKTGTGTANVGPVSVTAGAITIPVTGTFTNGQTLILGAVTPAQFTNVNTVGSGSLQVTANGGTSYGTDDKVIIIQSTGSTFSWSGGAGTAAWSTPTNWSGGTAPSANNGTENIIIPNGCSVYPTLPALNWSINGLSLDTSASITVASNNLTVNGVISNAGKIILSGAGTINVNDATKGTVSYTGAGQAILNLSYYNLSLAGSGTYSMSAPLTVANNLTISSGTLNQTQTVSTASLNVGTGSAAVITNNAALTVSGATTINTSVTGDVTLTNAGDSLGGIVTVTSGRNIALLTTGALQFGDCSISGTLGATAGGAITQTATTISASGTATFNATAAYNITLTSTGNDFSTVAITNGNVVQITDTNSITLGAATTVGAYTVNSGGQISGANVVAAGGTLTLNAATGINLTGANTSAVVGFSNSTSGSVSYSSSRALGLTISGANSSSGSGIAITEAGAAGITVSAGGITATAGTVTLRSNALAISGSISSGTANTYLLPNTVGTPASIGGAASYNLSQANLLAITAGTIVVGEDSTAARTAGAFSTGSSTVALGAENLTISGTSITGGANTLSTTGSVLLKTSGAVNGGGPAGADFAAGGLTINAATGIGASTQVKTAAATISFSNSTSGVVVISNTRPAGVSVSGTNSSSGSSITMTETSGLLTIGAPGLAATGAGTVSLTGVGVTNNTTVTGGGGVTVSAGTGTFTNSSGTLTNTGTGGAVAVTADAMSLGGGTVTAGSGAVTLRPSTAATQVVNLGGADAVGTLGLTSAELQTITTSGQLTIGDPSDQGQISISAAITPTNPSGGILIENKTGGIAIGANVTSAGSLTLTANAGGAAAGAITRTAGTLTATTGNLSVNGATGIGSISGTAPVWIAVPAGNFSANNTTSGDLYVRATGNVTVGVAAFGLTQYSGGALRVDSGGNITINGNVSVLGAGSIELEATGTITEQSAGAGTLSAATVRLGQNGATTLLGSGVGAGPIMTAASALLGAESSAGAVWLNNTGALADTSIAATGGLVNLQASSSVGLSTGSVASSNSTVTINAGGLLTVGSGRAVTAGAGSTVTTTSVGLTNSGTMTGPGGVSIDAGTGTLTNTGSVTNSGGATAVGLTADKMALAGGTITGGSGVVTLLQKTAGVAFNLGSATDLAASTVELSAAELNSIGTTGFLRIGNGSSGAVTVSGAVAPGSALNVHITSGGGIASSVAADTIGATNLALSAGGAINVTTASVGTVAAGTSAGGVTVSDANAGGTSVGTVDAVVGVTSGGTAVSVSETAGLLTLSQAVNAGASTVSLTGVGVTNNTTVTGGGGITVSAGTGTFTNSSGTLTTSNTASMIGMTANGWTLVGGTITTGTGAGSIVLTPNANGNISLGGAGKLTTAGLATLTTAGTVYIGDSGITTAYTGTIDILGAVNFGSNVPNAVLKARGSGGAITDSTGSAVGMAAAAGSLSFDADAGIGSIAGPTPVLVGAVGGSFSANNQTSGDLYVKTGGTVTIGVGAFGLVEHSGGALRVDSGLNLIIGGGVTVAGAGSITLNAVGTITRTAGTLGAATVSLGQANGTAIGASGAAIVSTATTSLAGKASGGDVWLSNTGNVNANAQATGGVVNILNAGTLTTNGAITSSISTVTISSSGTVSVGNNVTGPTGVTIGVTTLNTGLSQTAGIISTTSSAIALTADNMSLGGTISAGNANVTLLPFTNGTLVNLGGADAAGTLGLTNAELNSIGTTGFLRIGNGSSGAVTVSGAVAPGSALNVHITSGGGIASSVAADTIGATNLALSAGGAINVTTASVGTVAAGTSAGGVTVSDANAGGMSVGTVDAVVGVTSGGTAVSVSETAGLLTLSQAVNAGASTVSLTGVGVTNNTTVTGGGGVTVSAGTGTFTNSSGTLTNTGTGGAVAVTADAMSLGGGTVTAGSGAVTLRPSTAATQVVNLGGADAVGTLGLTSAELQTITTSGQLTIGDPSDQGQISISAAITPTNPSGGILIENKTGGIAIGANVTSAGSLTLTANAGGAAAGAITRTAGTLTATTGNLSVNGATGIGSISGTAPVWIAVPAGNFSANNTTSGDLYVRATGNVTVGVAAFGLTQYSGGALRVDSGGNITINGNVSVLGAGSIELEATGTITEQSAGAGTLSAATVRLGQNGATTLLGSGVGAGPIMTAASALLGAESSAGAVWLNNTGALADTSIAATGGLVNLQASSSVGLSTGSVASSNSTVTINAGGLLTVGSGRAVTAGAGSTVTTTSVGLTNSGTMTGPGGVSIDAGTGTLTNTGSVTNSGGATAVGLTADKMALAGGTITGGSGVVTLLQKTAGVAFNLGSTTDLAASTVELSAAELNSIGTTGFLRIGNGSSGAVTVSGAVAPGSALNVHITSGGGIASSVAADTIGATNLALSAGGAINVTTASVGTVAAGTSAGGVTVSDANAGGTSVGTVDAVVGVTSGGTAVSVSETAGLLTLSQAVNAGASTVSLTGVGVTNNTTVTGGGGISISGGTGLFTNAGILTNGGGAAAISAKADTMSLTGTINGGSGAVSLTSATITQPINLGGGSANLGLPSAGLNTISTSGPVTIGDVLHTGAISTDGSLTLTGPTGAVSLLSRGSTITLNNAVTTVGNLSLDTTGSGSTSGSVSGTGQLTIGAAGGSNLSVTTSNGINLQSAGPANKANGISLVNDTGGNINYVNNRTMTLAAANSAGGGILNVTNNTGNLSTSGAVSTTGPGAAYINISTAGTLAIGNAISAGGAGYVSLSSSGGTQTAILTAPGGLQLIGAGPYTLNSANAVPTVAANLTGAAAAISFTASAALAVGSVNGTSGITTNGGSCTVSTNSGDLTISKGVTTGSGTQDFTPTGNLLVDAALSSTNAAITLNPGGTISLAVAAPANVISSAGGAVNLQKAVALGANTSISSAAGLTSFSSTVDDSIADTHTLSVSGNASFGGIVGGTRIVSLLVTGTTATTAGAAAITTQTTQEYDGTFTLGADMNFAAGAASLIWFKSTVGGGPTARAVTITTAPVRFDAAVGGGANFVSSLDVTAGTSTINAASVSTTGSQTYAGAVNLGNDVDFTGGAASLIWFQSTLGGGGTPRAITITTAPVQLDGAVGDLGNLATSLDVTAGTTALNANVTTSGAQTYTGAVTLGSNVSTISGAGAITFSSTVGQSGTRTLAIQNAASTGTVTFSGSVTLQGLTTVAGNYVIALNAGGTIANAVSFLNTGGLTISAGLTATGGLSSIGTGINSFAGSIATGGALGQDIAVSNLTIGAGGVAFNSGASGNLGITGTVAGGSNNLTLTNAGTATFGGPVTAVGTLTVTNSNGTVFQSTVGAAAVTLTATTGTIEFDDALTASSGLTTAANGFGLSFNQKTGAQTSTIAGPTTLQNSGAITLGNDPSDIVQFTGGLTMTDGANRHLIGSIRTNGQPISVGSAILDGNATLDSTNGALGGANISVGAITINGPATPVMVINAGTAGAFSQSAGTIAATKLRIIASGSIGTSLATPVSTQVSNLEARSYNGTVFISNTGIVNIGFALGDFEFLVTPVTGGGIVTTARNSGLASNGQITFVKPSTSTTATFVATAPNLSIGATITANGGIALYPDADSTIMNINDSVAAFFLTTPMLKNLVSTSSVTLGRTTGTGAINIGSAGAINLSATTTYNLTLQGTSSSVNFDFAATGNSLSLSNAKTLTIATGGAVSTNSTAATVDVTIAGAAVLDASSVASMGAAAFPIRVSVATLRAPATNGALYVTATGALALGDATRAVSAANGAIGIVAGGLVTMGAAVTTTDAGAIARPISITGASIAVSQNIQAANSGQITLATTTGAITRVAPAVVGLPGSTSLLVLASATAIGVDALSDNLVDPTWLFTDVGTIRATAANGGLFVSEASAVQLGDAIGGVIATGGNVDVTAGGAITTGTAFPISAGGAASDLYLSGATLAISATAGAGRVVNLTGTAGIAIAVGTGVVNGGTGLMTFNNTVSQSAGAINVGAGGLRFATDYTASGSSALTGFASATPPTIDFRGNVVLPPTALAFTHNGDAIVFDGLAPQTFDSFGQIVGNVLINNAAGVQVTGHDVSQTGGTYGLTIQAGTLDLATNSRGWVADSGATLPTANTFHGAVGTLTLQAGALVSCGSFTADATYSINNAGANTISASGNVSILMAASSFVNPTNSTIVITGTANLDAVPPIGFLQIAGTGNVTLQTPLVLDGNPVNTPDTSLAILSGGTLDVNAASIPAGGYPISIATDWHNYASDAAFNARSGTVTVTRQGGTLSFWGDNTFYNFTAVLTGATLLTIQFENQKIQTVMNALTLSGFDAAHTITLTRTTITVPVNPPNIPPVPTPIVKGTPNTGGETFFWYLDLQSTAALTLINLTVFYSSVELSPIVTPPTVVATLNAPQYCWRWIPGIPVLYSYTEDADQNGKIDRIRIQTPINLGGNFSGLKVNVAGYVVTGYSFVPGSPKDFYVLLKEKPYNDTDARPQWNIVSNTSLGQLTTVIIPLDPTAIGIPTDTAPPILTYTAAVPGTNKAFLHFSESVHDQNGAAISPFTFMSSAGIASVTPVSPASPNAQEYSIGLGSSVNINYIFQQNTINVANVRDTAVAAIPLGSLPGWPGGTVDPPNYPNSWAPQPGTFGEAPLAAASSHRISDVLVDVPIATITDAGFFMWPIYAKDSVALALSDAAIAALTPAQTASQGIGLIRAFDGSQWLRAQNISLQARLQPALTGVLGITLWFDSNVSAGLTASNGLWLPSFAETGFSGLVPFPDSSAFGGRGASPSPGIPAGTNLFNFALPASNARISSISKLGFFFTFQTAAPVGQPMYALRLDLPAGAPAGAVPPDTATWQWYRNLKPFAFDIHNVALQKGGATILNNVINPTKGETARLSYQLPSDGAVTITVFTLDGDVVARLANERKAAGDYAVDWNGRNLAGTPVARGLYFIRIVAPGIDEMRKVLVVR